MGLRPPALWGTSCHAQPVVSASPLPQQCQSGLSRVSSPCLSSNMPAASHRNKCQGAGPAYSASSRWHCHQTRSQATKPPSLMSAVGQDTLVAPSKLPGPWQWHTHPACRAPHIWEAGLTQEPWLQALLHHAAEASVLAPQQDSSQSRCADPGNRPRVRSPEPALASPDKHQLHGAGGSASSAARWERRPSGRQGARLQPTGDVTPSLICPGGGRGQIASSRLRCSSASKS